MCELFCVSHLVSMIQILGCGTWFFSPVLPIRIHLADVKIGCDCDGGSNDESPELESLKEKAGKKK